VYQTEARKTASPKAGAMRPVTIEAGMPMPSSTAIMVSRLVRVVTRRPK
jgi:hypothetical protein